MAGDPIILFNQIDVARRGELLRWRQSRLADGEDAHRAADEAEIVRPETAQKYDVTPLGVDRTGDGPAA